MLFFILCLSLAHEESIENRLPVWTISLSKFELYRPTYLAASDDGRLCIYNKDTSQLLFLSSTGELVAKHSGKGQGPKEIERVWGLGHLEKENLFWVWDRDNHRVSFWNEKGQVKLVRYSNDWFSGYSLNMTENNSGFYLNDNFGELGSQPSVFFINLDTKEKKTIYQHEKLEKQVGLHYHEKGQNIRANFEWDPMLTFAVNPEYLAVSYTDTSEIKVFDNDKGALHSKFKTAFKRRRVEEGDRRRIIAEEIPDYMREDLVPHLNVPEYWPAISDMALDSASRLWLFSFPEGPEGRLPFQVFTLNGKTIYKGKIHSKPVVIRKDHMYVLSEEEVSKLEGDFQLKKIKINDLNLRN